MRRLPGQHREAFPSRRDEEAGDPRYLRSSQLRALEAYWYLRLIGESPRIAEPYLHYRKEGVYVTKQEPVEASGVPAAAWQEPNVDPESANLVEAIENDDDGVSRHKLQMACEVLALAYPKYSLALATGAGKTVLVGAIIATAFPRVLEYDGVMPHPPTPALFVEHALVFAPGKALLARPVYPVAAFPLARPAPLARTHLP